MLKFRTLLTAVAASLTVSTSLVVQMAASLDRVPNVESSSAQWNHLPEKLEVMSQISTRRFDAVSELVAGRSSLRETAETFRALSAECPYDPLPYLHNLYPDHTDEELHYVHVLCYIEAVRCQEGTTATVVDGYRKEFESLRSAGKLFADEDTPK
jgi:hypothetical protein